MELVSYVAKCVLGGSLVCLFALIAEVCQPKRFAGLFSAAPSVLLAGLAVTLFSQGSATARLTAEGAVVGAIGMVAYSLMASPAMRRFKALPGAALSLLLWFAITLGIYFLLALVPW